MKNKLVRTAFDPKDPPSLTDDERAEIRKLGEMSDDDIDYSDITQLDEAFWTNAIRNPFVRPRKQQITLRLDSDLIAWFKQENAGARGYQTGINAALRDHVNRRIHDKASDGKMRKPAAE